MANVVLSQRLQCLTNMVTRGNVVADVGCDHGFLSIYLVQNHISSKVLAMDVRTGPLSQAKAHISECGLSDYIETRLSDGIEQLECGEAQTLVVAGMGGPLMRKILSDHWEKTESIQELILQPQSEIPQFRMFLREHGYQITEEHIVLEDGKYYFPMKAVRKKNDCTEEEWNPLYDYYGRLLIAHREPLLMQYLKQKEDTISEIIVSMKKADKDRAKTRLLELEQELCGVREAIQMMETQS